LLKFPSRSRAGQDAGYTLVELMVVLAIMGIVLSIAGGILVSLQNTTVRTTSLISEEQDASNTLAQMARDVRSAHSITFATTTSDASKSVVLDINSPSGTTSPIEWVYVPPSGSAAVGQLERLVLNSSLGVVATSMVLRNVANTSATPVFSYYNLQDAAMGTSGSSADQTLQNCTTSIGVTLVISPSPTRNVADFTESEQIAITDQEQILSAPGNQQCGLTS
jgi:prepilin-type N-terminal cleavage/methylation domain-containing protein